MEKNLLTLFFISFFSSFSVHKKKRDFIYCPLRGNVGKATSSKACKRMIPNWKLLNLAFHFLLFFIPISFSYSSFVPIFLFFYKFLNSFIPFFSSLFHITIPIEIVQFFCIKILFFRTKFHFEWHSLHHASNAHRI